MKYFINQAAFVLTIQRLKFLKKPVCKCIKETARWAFFKKKNGASMRVYKYIYTRIHIRVYTLIHIHTRVCQT